MLMKKGWPKQSSEWASTLLKANETYLRTMRKALESEAKQLKRQAKRETKSLNGEEKGARERWYELRHIEMTHVFPMLCYESALVSLFSGFEYTLLAFCEKMRRVRDYQIGVEDLKDGRTVEGCKAYMTKVAHVKFPSNLSEWQEIKNIQKVRNKIIHNRGWLYDTKMSKDDKDVAALRKFIASKNARVTVAGRIVVTDDFCHYAIDLIRRFLKALADVTPDE